MLNIDDEFDDAPLTEEDEKQLGPMAKTNDELDDLSDLGNDIIAEVPVQNPYPKKAPKPAKIKEAPKENKSAVPSGENSLKQPGEKKDGDELARVRIIEAEGKEKRKKRAVDLGLSDLILPPMTRNTIAVYQYTGGLDPDFIDPSTGQKPDLKDAVLPGTYWFHDKFETDLVKKNKLMRNLGRPQVIKDRDGNDRLIDTIKDVEFTAGFLRVDCLREYRLYVWAELHPLNGSNKHRDNTNEIKFIRIDIKNNKSEMFKNAEYELGFDAEAAIRKIVKKDEIIALAVSLGCYDAGLDPGSLRTAAIKKARENPKKFFSMSRDLRPAIKLNVIDGLGLGLIEYNADKKTYFFTETSERIHTHSISEDPLNSLVEHMVSHKNLTGMSHYEKLMETLDYWEV